MLTIKVAFIQHEVLIREAADTEHTRQAAPKKNLGLILGLMSLISLSFGFLICAITTNNSDKCVLLSKSSQVHEWPKYERRGNGGTVR